MVLVESAFMSENESSHGAAGFWQFTPATARSYGLTVDGARDRIRGKKGTQVVLTVSRGGVPNPVKLTITRDVMRQVTPR